LPGENAQAYSTSLSVLNKKVFLNMETTGLKVIKPFLFVPVAEDKEDRVLASGKHLQLSLTFAIKPEPTQVEHTDG
jgi:hypothetical protein